MQVIEVEVTDDNCLRVKIGRLKVVPKDSPANWMNSKKSEFRTGGTVMVAIANLVSPGTHDLTIFEACKPFTAKFKS
jgi:hypothetical protein